MGSDPKARQLSISYRQINNLNVLITSKNFAIGLNLDFWKLMRKFICFNFWRVKFNNHIKFY